MKKDYIWLGAYSLFISAIIIIRLGGEDVYPYILSIITYITPCIAIYFGIMAIMHFNFKSTHGKSLFFLVAMLFAWLIGDIIYIFVGDLQSTSAADAFYLLGYIFFGIGLYLGIRTISNSIENPNKKMLILFAAVALSFFAYFAFFPITWNPDIRTLENIVASAYIVADVILLAFSVLLISSIFSGTYSRGWLLIAGGTFLTFIGDIYYALNYQNYLNGDIIDLAWLLGYVLFALAFIKMKDSAEDAMKRALQKNKIN